MDTSTTLAELAKALSKAQGQLTSVPKNAVNPFYKNRYADLDAVWDTIRKPLSENGLSIAQTTYFQGTQTHLLTRLLHLSGEWIESDLPINAKSQDPQAVGSALSYSRRYSICAILGVSAGEDDDAEGTTNHAVKSTPNAQIKSTEVIKPQPATQLTPGSNQWILNEVTRLKVPEDKFLDWLNKELHIPIEKTLKDTLEKSTITPDNRMAISKKLNEKAGK